MNLKDVLSRVFNATTQEEIKEFEKLELDQKEMIRGVVELSDTTVKEVMVPRIDTVFVSVDMNQEEMLEKIAESGHSRFPVYKDTIDNVVGILYVKDLLRALVKHEVIDMQTILRKPFFVPESKRIDDLLRDMRRKRVHIAVAVDEYGGVSGIVCMEDIIEEIVGDIQDEFDNEREDILQIGEGVYLCDARLNLEDLAEALQLELPIEDFDTLGGFVFDLFGKIPVKYEKVSFGGHDFIIQDMEGHKINTVKIVLNRSKSE